MGTNYAPLVADLFLFCYEMSLSDNKQVDVFEAFTSATRILDVLLNIDNPYFEKKVSQTYPTEFEFNNQLRQNPLILILRHLN